MRNTLRLSLEPLDNICGSFPFMLLGVGILLGWVLVLRVPLPYSIYPFLIAILAQTLAPTLNFQVPLFSSSCIFCTSLLLCLLPFIVDLHKSDH